MDLAPLGRMLVATGVLLALAGAALLLADRLPLVGRLPGDLVLRGDRWTLYVPLATALLVSIALTLALSLLAWLARR